jgi:hypothetical protein
MRVHKFRHNYHKDYLAMKKGTYDYSKIYSVSINKVLHLTQGGMIHKHGELYIRLGLDMSLQKIKENMTNRYIMLQLFKNCKENLIWM